MEQYTVKGFEELIVNDSYYNSISKTQNKLLFIDKCNWVINSIAKKNFAIDKGIGEYVKIHSTTFKRVLGDKYYIQVLSSLESLGIIKVNRKYSAGRFSNSYRLTFKAKELGIIVAPFLSKRFPVTLERFFHNRFNKVYADPLLRKILDNTAQLKMLDEKQHYYMKFITWPNESETKEDYIKRSMKEINDDSLARYDEFFYAFRDLNETTDPYEVFKSTISYEPRVGQYGRVYHIAANIPRYVRECIRTKDGEMIYEVDMSSAQFSILTFEWIKWLKRSDTNKEERDEANLLASLVFRGEVYAYIIDNSNLMSEMNYKEMKLTILSTLNAKFIPSKLNLTLLELFPNFMNWINNLKRIEGHESVSHLGQSSESNIFVETYKKIPNDKFCIIIHDSILVKKEDTDYVKKLLIDRTLEIYGHLLKGIPNLENLFKVTNTSLPDEELPSNSWYKNKGESWLNL